MKYSIQGKNAVTLTGSDFMTSGGEAQVFRKGSVVYKIYHKPSDMIPDSKIHELQEIKKDNVLVPKDIILDPKGVRVGFTMDYVDNVLPLCKLFTNTYIEQNDISNDTIVELVKVMQETIESIHSAACIQVDGNELNYLVDSNTHKKPYFIDVNSYQTRSFPATVIMPSIRDWTTNVFNELTDWYSFATIACQLFVGIHPYKGKHPDFKKYDIENRMKAHVSIFNKQIQLPKSVRDFSRIPSNYMEWFINVLEKGKRLAPPSTVGAVNAKLTYTVVVSTDNFDIQELEEFDDVVLYHSNFNSIPITRTKKSIYIGSAKYRVRKGTYLVHTQKKSIPVLVAIQDNVLAVKSADPRFTVSANANIHVEELLVIDNTVYVRSGSNLLETQFIENDTSAMLAVRNVWTIHENSSSFFKNVVIQDILGTKYISIPVPKIKNSTFTSLKCDALEGYKVLDAKYENNVCVLSVYNNKDNQYKLLVIPDVTDIVKSARFVTTEEYNQVNFTVLENGLILLLYDEQLEVFSSAHATKVKIIKDKQLSTNMSLCKRGVTVRFFTDNKLYSIKMKQSK